MRISSSTINRYVNQDLMKHQVEIADLQAKISSGKRLEKPSDDPVNAARHVNLSASLSQFDQYGRNINLAKARLSTEETRIANSENILLRVRELALISNNTPTSPEVYPAITTELEHLRADLISQANAKDADGNYIFSGNMTSTEPFDAGDPDNYRGDDQSRIIQINQSQNLATSDTGKDIFQNILASDQSHTVTANPANNGQASILLSSSGAGGTSNGAQYALEFLTPTTYNILNLTSGITEVTGASLSTSNTVDHAGIQIKLSGSPATNDVFNLEPTVQKDVFDTLNDFIQLLKSPPANDSDKALHQQKMNGVLIGVDQAFEHMTIKRAEIGNRLSMLDNVRQENEDTGFQLKETLSEIEDLDYADAITKLQQRAIALEVLQKSITRTQGLSLFNN